MSVALPLSKDCNVSFMISTKALSPDISWFEHVGLPVVCLPANSGGKHASLHMQRRLPPSCIPREVSILNGCFEDSCYSHYGYFVLDFFFLTDSLHHSVLVDRPWNIWLRDSIVTTAVKAFFKHLNMVRWAKITVVDLKNCIMRNSNDLGRHANILDPFLQWTPAIPASALLQMDSYFS